MNIGTFPADECNATLGNSGVSGNGIHMVMIWRTAFRGIAKKLQNHALVYLEFDPAVQGHVGSSCYKHDKRDNNL